MSENKPDFASMSPEQKKAYQEELIARMSAELEAQNRESTEESEKNAPEDKATSQPEPKKKEEVAKKEPQTEKEKVLAEIQSILQEHNNMESRIPTDHRYWGLVNRYRGLRNAGTR